MQAFGTATITGYNIIEINFHYTYPTSNYFKKDTDNNTIIYISTNDEIQEETHIRVLLLCLHN